MSIELRVASGARAGAVQAFDKSIVTIGRHPMCDLRFDPEADRDVSARHADIRADGDRWVLRDTGSTNGTWVNGVRLAREHALRVGDVVGFGEYGPRLEVLALVPYLVPAGGVIPSPVPRPAGIVPSPVPIDVAATMRASGRGGVAAPAPSAPAVPASPALRTPMPRPTTGERIAMAVKEHTRGLRRLVIAGFALAVVAVAGAFWMARRDAGERRAEIDALIRRNDSLTAAFDRQMRAASGAVTGLDSALAVARTESEALRARIAGAKTEGEVRAATVALARVQEQRTALASANTSIASRNSPAVAILAVQFPGAQAWTGTAFGVSSRGLLVTNRHLVRTDAGVQAEAVLVKFSGTRDWLPARVVSVSEDDDIALLQIDGKGLAWPAVSGIARAPAVVGAPVAILGYPLGLETAMEGRGAQDFVASATLGVGTTSKVLGDVLQIDAFAGEGSSGSPVFDREGRVAGVVYGGARESGGRIVYAVPAARLLAALPAEARP